MAGLSTGLKEKLTISPCTVSKDGSITVESKKFEVMLNPASYKYERSICYNEKPTLGQLAPDTKFSAMGAEKVSFDIVIDGTGVVNLPIPGVGSPDVKTQVQQLTDIVYNYQGKNHEPNPVRLLWGSFIFFGRLETMSTDYTLFKPTGEPLRAKIKLSFTSSMSKEHEELVAKKSSPDLTHYVEVKAGDTLPLLCYRVYKDSSYYAEVAKVNNIANFRSLEPGRRLEFPPLR